MTVLKDAEFPYRHMTLPKQCDIEQFINDLDHLKSSGYSRIELTIIDGEPMAVVYRE